MVHEGMGRRAVKPVRLELFRCVKIASIPEKTKEAGNPERYFATLCDFIYLYRCSAQEMMQRWCTEEELSNERD